MSDRKTAATLLWVTVLVVWGLITHGTYAGSGDEPHYLMIARSIAFDGDVHLANDYGDSENLIGAGTVVAGAHVRPGRDGALRPVHDIGLPLLAAPIVRVLYPLAAWLDATVPRAWLTRAKLNGSLLLRHFLSLLMAVIAGLIAIEISRVLLEVGLNRRRAFWWALLATLSPPLLSYAFLFFTELVAALIVLVCLRRLREPSWSWHGGLLTGALVGLLSFIHIRNAPISFALAAVAVVTHRRRVGELAPFAIGIAAVAAVRTAVNWHFWGRLFTNDHARLGQVGNLADTLREIGVRASGLLLDQEFGLLALAPIYVLALPGLVRLWRRAPAIARPLAAVVVAGVVPLLLPFVNVHGWTGTWSPAPRFLVPIAPLLAIMAAVVAAGATGLRATFVAVLVALQVVIDIIVWNEPKVLWNDGDGVSAVTQAIPALRSLYAALPAWHSPAASPWPFVTGVLMCMAIAAWLLTGGYRLQTPGPRLRSQAPAPVITDH